MKIRLVLGIVASMLWCCVAGAQIVSTVVDNGDPANRIDLVIVGDGYTASEQNKFSDDVNAFFNAFFAKEFFADYRSYFNLRTVFVASVESGATHNERSPVVTKNTAFGSYFGCASIDRLICTDTNKVFNAVSTALPANQRDYIFVIVNDTTYGGSGGTISVASTNYAAVEVLLHEFGHTFGQLADEYDYSPPACNLTEPGAANATTVTTRSDIKWRHWIANTTPVPTLDTTPSTPGLYQGADYCTAGMYRPTYNSKMRSLNQPYDQINEEQMVRKIYTLVTPLESYAPTTSSNSLTMSDTLRFSVSTTQPIQHPLQISWSVDSGQVASGSSTAFDFDTTQFSAGNHAIQVNVHDTTSRVRSDPSHLLEDNQSWTVNVAIGSNVVSALDMQASATDVALGSSVTFTAQATPASGKATPTGVVKFIESGNVIGSARLDTAGKAILATSSLTAGAHNVTATYYGDSIYKQASSAAKTVNVVAPDFTVALQRNDISIISGQSGQLVLTLKGNTVSIGQAASFVCSNLPVAVSCAFSPAPVTLSTGDVTTTLTVSTSLPPPVMSSGSTKTRYGIQTIALPVTSIGLLMFGLLGAQSLSAVFRLRALIVIILSLLLSSCGGSHDSVATNNVGNSSSSSISSNSSSSTSSASSSSSSSSSSSASGSKTPAGSYSIIVTVTSTPAGGTAISYSVPINLTVTN